MRNGNDLDPLDLVSRYVWRGRKDATRYLCKGHLDSYVTTCRSLPTEEQFSSNGRVANRHSLIRTLMNDGTFVSLVQRGTGLTDIRGRMYVARPKKQTNLKVKRGRVIRLISRLWQQCALATDRPPAPPSPLSPHYFAHQPLPRNRPSRYERIIVTDGSDSRVVSFSGKEEISNSSNNYARLND